SSVCQVVVEFVARAGLNVEAGGDPAVGMRRRTEIHRLDAAGGRELLPKELEQLRGKVLRERRGGGERHDDNGSKRPCSIPEHAPCFHRFTFSPSQSSPSQCWIW